MNHTKLIIWSCLIVSLAAIVGLEQVVKAFTGNTLVAIGTGLALGLPVYLFYRWMLNSL